MNTGSMKRTGRSRSKLPAVTRRSFLGRTIGTTAALVAGSLLRPPPLLASSPSTPPGNPLRLPLDWDGSPLVASPTDIEVWPEQHAALYAINGLVPAPTIRLRKGSRFAARVENRLEEDLVLHWHGILSPASMDGHPRDAVAPGQGYTVDFPVLQPAATYFYHAHTDRLTGRQVYLGLAGLFIVEDPAEQRLGLPSGSRDVPLVLQDRRTHGEMHIAYEPDEMDIATGFLGDAVFVNNTPNAYLEVARALYRFRIVNASNARIYRLGLEDERPFHLIANDAGLLSEPLSVETIMLAPGQRAEILVDFRDDAPGDSVVLKSHPFEGGGHGGDGGNEGDDEHRPMQGTELDVLTLHIAAGGAEDGMVPARLGPSRALHETVARRTRLFNLEVSGLLHPINGSLFDPERVDFTVPFGEYEIWEYVNSSDEFHPMHPHGALLQVLERHGAEGLPPEDLGLKDTVLVAPGETVRVLIRYQAYSGSYVHHCHNLEHEDNGMMQSLEVRARRRIRRDGATLLPSR